MIKPKHVFLFLFFCINLSFSNWNKVDSLILQAVNGGIERVLPGVTYYVVFDAYGGATTLSPNNNGETPTGDLGVNISGEISSGIHVIAKLPDFLPGTNGGRMNITFPTSGPGSGVRMENGGFFNPHIPNTFNLGGGGSCNLRLGYQVTIPPNFLENEVQYSGTIQFIVSYLDGSGGIVESSTDTVTSVLTINPSNMRLELQATNGYVTNLSTGISYNISYDAFSQRGYISPITNKSRVLSDVGFNIAGVMGSNVVMTLFLPTQLRSQSGTTIGISFPKLGSGSGVRIETGGTFNPNVTNTFNPTQHPKWYLFGSCRL